MNEEHFCKYLEKKVTYKEIKSETAFKGLLYNNK